MEDLPWFVVLLGIVGVALTAVLLATVVAVVSDRRVNRNIEREIARAASPTESLEQKLGRIIDLSAQLKSLNSEVQAEFELTMAAARKAQQDAHDAATIAALNADERRAAARMVAAQIEAAVGRNGKKDRRFQVWLSIGGFVAGVVATIVTSFAFAAAGPGGA